MLEAVQAIAAIVLIDLALSGDNALVIGVVARGLPRSKRRQAIVFGAGAAVVLRIAAPPAATVLLRIPRLQLVGGVALVVIAYRLVRPEAASGRSPRGMTTLGAAGWTIRLAGFSRGPPETPRASAGRRGVRGPGGSRPSGTSPRCRRKRSRRAAGRSPHADRPPPRARRASRRTARPPGSSRSRPPGRDGPASR